MYLSVEMYISASLPKEGHEIKLFSRWLPLA